MDGKIIVFEGLPNAGKTVNIDLLKQDFPDFHYVPELATMLFKEQGIVSGEKATEETALDFWRRETSRALKAEEDKTDGEIIIFDRNREFISFYIIFIFSLFY